MLDNILKYYKKIMILKIFIENDDLKELYKASVAKHNYNILNNKYLDAGFDLYIPNNYEPIKLDEHKFKVDFNIKCAAHIIYNYPDGVHTTYNTGFYMYPRSSLSNTNLRLANSVGIIDSGYRGNLMGVFDIIDDNGYNISNGYRLVQICAPSLNPIYVELVDFIDELGSHTERGEGGFGSTNIK